MPSVMKCLEAVSPRAERLFLPPDAPLRRAFEVIERNKAKIVLVVDADRRLLGTVTDGDIRRGLLGELSLDSAVEQVMNRVPHVATLGESPMHIYELMLLNNLRQIPLVDQARRVLDIGLLNDFLMPEPLDNVVLIMAGGEGKRLRPLTETIPKPMLSVGGRPILETIIDRFSQQGLRNLLLSVNYRADIIRKHFDDGHEYGVHIRYIQEERPLGTAGSLRLLPERPSQPFIVVNGDVLTTLNYRDLLAFHQETGSLITICTQQYQVSVPFGVLKLEGDDVLGLEEKPIYSHPISSGIYVLDPAALDLMPEGEDFVDMPQIVAAALAQNSRVAAFPIREYWTDVGRIEDLQRAHAEFQQVFG